MRLRASALAVLAAIGAGGCASYERGRLAMASVKAIDVPLTIVDAEAEGRSCATMFDARYELAVENALIRSPGSNALMNASYHFERLCITVRGTAVHVPGRAPPPDPGDAPTDTSE